MRTCFLLALLLVGCNSLPTKVEEPILEKPNQKSLEERCSDLGGTLVYNADSTVVDRHFNTALEGCRR